MTLGQLVLYLNIVEALVVADFAHRFQVLTTYGLSIEINRPWGRHLDFAAACADLVKHGQVVVRGLDPRTAFTLAHEVLLRDASAKGPHLFFAPLRVLGDFAFWSHNIGRELLLVNFLF